MNCIVVDDEPLAREAVELLIRQSGSLDWFGSFNSADAAADFMIDCPVDLVFLDIQMPHINGLDFARSLSSDTLIVFTTAYTEYALDSYEIDAIDYLVKPIKFERFQKAVNKAVTYHSLLKADKTEDIEEIDAEFIIVKSERRFFKIELAKILFIEGLKDYVIIHTEKERIITKMNLKNIHERLPGKIFLRVNKSFIVNSRDVDSFDNNDIYIKTHIVPIGNVYRDAFLNNMVMSGL